MITYAINFLTLFIQSVLVAFFFHSILATKYKPAVSNTILVLVIFFSYLAAFIFPFALWLKTVLNFILAFVLLLLLYTGSFRQIFLAFMIFFIVNNIAELAATGIVIRALGFSFSDIAQPGLVMNILRGFYIIIVTALYLLTIFLWHRKQTGVSSFRILWPLRFFRSVRFCCLRARLPPMTRAEKIT